MERRLLATALTLSALLAALFAALVSAVDLSIEQRLQEKFDQGLYSRQGADTCLKCHDGQSASNALGIFDNIHGQHSLAGGPFSPDSTFGLQCETCHGPDGDHSRARLRRGKSREPVLTFGQHAAVSASGQNSVCLSCHNDANRMTWQGSEHQAAAFRCTDCHQLHQASDDALPTSGCNQCHVQQAAFRHLGSLDPLQQHQPKCSACHNAHGSLFQDDLRAASTVELCTQCHADKRGPFLWEHAPVSEDCTLCHAPHGGSQSDQLVMRPPLLCQNCHAGVDSDHQARGYFTIDDPGAASYLLGGSCMNCHSQIHGSNHPSGNTFQR